MNVAEITIERYDNCLAVDYAQILFEEYSNNEHEIIKRIQDLFNIQNYETEKYYGHTKYVSKEKCKEIYDLINEDIESFFHQFSGYWVGSTSLESVAYGEQEEQLSGWYNSRTKKDYTLPYMKKVFSDAGFVVNGDLAYMDFSSSGIHIDLINAEFKDRIVAILERED